MPSNRVTAAGLQRLASTVDKPFRHTRSANLAAARQPERGHQLCLAANFADPDTGTFSRGLDDQRITQLEGCFTQGGFIAHLQEIRGRQTFGLPHPFGA